MHKGFEKEGMMEMGNWDPQGERVCEKYGNGNGIHGFEIGRIKTTI